MIQFLTWDGNSVEFIDAGMMGRAASKIEAFDDEPAALHGSASALLGSGGNYGHAFGMSHPDAPFDLHSLRLSFLVGRSDREPVCTAKRVEASRLSFPGPRSFGSKPYMDDLTNAIFDAPMSFAKRPSQFLEPLPKVRVHVVEENKVALYKLLADSGRLKCQRSEMGSCRECLQ